MFFIPYLFLSYSFSSPFLYSLSPLPFLFYLLLPPLFLPCLHFHALCLHNPKQVSCRWLLFRSLSIRSVYQQSGAESLILEWRYLHLQYAPVVWCKKWKFFDNLHFLQYNTVTLLATEVIMYLPFYRNNCSNITSNFHIQYETFSLFTRQKLHNL